jgi:hypothetical protein
LTRIKRGAHICFVEKFNIIASILLPRSVKSTYYRGTHLFASNTGMAYINVGTKDIAGNGSVHMSTGLSDEDMNPFRSDWQNQTTYLILKKQLQNYNF